MKSTKYCDYFPIYLTKAGSDTYDTIAIVKLEHDLDMGSDFVRNYVIHTLVVQNLYVVVVRLAILGIIRWSRYFWKDTIPWAYHNSSKGLSFKINANKDYLTFPLRSNISDSDVDILTNIGNIPVITANKLTIKELMIYIWKKYTIISNY